MTPRIQEYGERAERFDRAAAVLERRSRLLSNLRGSSFGIFVIAGLVGLFGDGGTAALGLSAVAFVSFAVLVIRHGNVLAEEELEKRWARINRDALARASGQWSELDDGAGLLPDEHPYAADLDLVGRRSVFQRISSARTPYGRRALAAMLGEPAPLDVLEKRQQAARVLAPELELRQRLEVHALGAWEPTSSRGEGARRRPGMDPARFVAWAESAPVLSGDRIVVWSSRLLPPVTLMLVFGSALGLLPSWGWLALVVAQVFVSSRASQETGRVFAAVSETQGALASYGPLFEVVENLSLDAHLIAELRNRMQSPKLRPSTAMRRFSRIVGWFELRHNGLVHPFVNAFTLWDIHCVLALENWQADSGREVRHWLATVGEMEALSSFGGLAYDEPSFCWPEVSREAPHFIAESLGHPLIDAERRVGNDVHIGAPGHGLLVTGSNMSGKSTLLRSMGLAAVMALAGAPVCASRCRLSSMAIRTSLRVRDSLEQGVSHFYAEVAKLKQALDAAERSEPVLFLLDEILHGTNSEERQIGARWVLARLLDRGAIGVVTTHDAELCRLGPPLSECLDQRHFREHVEGGKMTFDYRLRPGPVRGGNALRVMRLLGMPVPLPDEPPHPEPQSLT